MMRRILAVAASLVLLAVGHPATAQEETTVTHAIAEFGTPKYGPDFTHLDYADPDAPKGGSLTLTTVGTFDTLNRLPIAGQWPRNLGLIYDSLMVETQDEISVQYGLLAETVEYPEDHSWAIFTLRPEARFSDGQPVTAEDVAWSIRAIRDHADPFLASYVAAVSEIEALDDRRIKFTFDGRGGIKPIMQVGIMPVYARHWWEDGRNIAEATLEPPVGSGPYRLAEIEPGRRLVYERDPDYWAQDLPIVRGHWNFDRIEYLYFRDRTVEFEAFKGGAGDFRHEFTSLFWATGYDVPAVADGRLIKAEVPGTDFRGLQGWFFNLRRPPFDDIRVREALGLLFDFQWVNQNLFYGFYERLDTYFLAPGYSAEGLPTEAELAILEPYRDQLPEELFTTDLSPPVSDGSGSDRRLIRRAMDLFREAGFEPRDGRLVDIETGQQLSFEIILGSPQFERITQPWISNMERVGIAVTMRVLDSATFVTRYEARDFDVLSFAYSFYPPPGREEANRFGSEAADTPGSANIMGISDPVVDALLAQLIAAETLEDKQTISRALDRVLRAGHYAVPHWYKDGFWVAYWDRFGFPDTQPPYDFGLANEIAFQPTWWIDPEKDRALTERGR
ncbi:extracellular solute-binding protein [Inquilinus sp. CAU 1745]|uniref:extracellular solute-binding protein n=1 Tax=Inquilinus sp. CAU 1745 TaxID=3140369 RepID=UPI00325BAA62